MANRLDGALKAYGEARMATPFTEARLAEGRVQVFSPRVVQSDGRIRLVDLGQEPALASDLKPMAPLVGMPLP